MARTPSELCATDSSSVRSLELDGSLLAHSTTVAADAHASDVARTRSLETVCTPGVVGGFPNSLFHKCVQRFYGVSARNLAENRLAAWLRLGLELTPVKR